MRNTIIVKPVGSKGRLLVPTSRILNVEEITDDMSVYEHSKARSWIAIEGEEDSIMVEDSFDKLALMLEVDPK